MDFYLFLLTKLQNWDDMDIMNKLMNLFKVLSLSSDQIGDNSNISKLLEEIYKKYRKNTSTWNFNIYFTM